MQSIGEERERKTTKERKKRATSRREPMLPSLAMMGRTKTSGRTKPRRERERKEEGSDESGGFMKAKLGERNEEEVVLCCVVLVLGSDQSRQEQHSARPLLV